MGTKTITSIDLVLRNLTYAELHELLDKVQAELLQRPGQAGTRTVDVVTTDEGALLALYRSLSTAHQAVLWRMASYVGATAPLQQVSV
jgi:hypothetical protein